MKKISKEYLIKIYNELPNTEVCKILGITQPTLSRLLDDNGIPKKGASGRVKKVIVVD